LSSEQKNSLNLNHIKPGHLGKEQGIGGNGGKGGGKINHAHTLKSMQRAIAALSTRFDKFNLPDDGDNDTSKDEDGDDASNCSNQALTRHTKKRGKYPNS
jgi:hypothetical protein